MNQTKGFTLVELLGTIVILGIIALIATPPIINQVKNAKSKVSSSSLDYIYSVGESYIKENLNNYSTDNSAICIEISELIDNGKVTDLYIKENNIDTESAIRYTMNTGGKIIGSGNLYNSTCTSTKKVTLSN